MGIVHRSWRFGFGPGLPGMTARPASPAAGSASPALPSRLPGPRPTTGTIRTATAALSGSATADHQVPVVLADSLGHQQPTPQRVHRAAPQGERLTDPDAPCRTARRTSAGCGLLALRHAVRRARRGEDRRVRLRHPGQRSAQRSARGSQRGARHPRRRPSPCSAPGTPAGPTGQACQPGADGGRLHLAQPEVPEDQYRQPVCRRWHRPSGTGPDRLPLVS